MEIKIAVEAGGLAKSLARFKQQFPQLVKKGLVDSAAILHQLSLRKISEQIYSKPETTVMRRSRITGRVRKVQLWKRTSDLYRAEAAGADYSGLNEYRVILDNNSPYAWRRHQLKYPAKTKIRTLSGRGKKATYTTIPRPDRTAHWREDALKQGLPQMRDAYRKAIAAINNS